MNTYIKKFKEISIADIAVVGGKNSSLGEMFRNFAQRVFRCPMVLPALLLLLKNFLRRIYCNYQQGIDNISFNPDALLKGMENINQAELYLLVKT